MIDPSGGVDVGGGAGQGAGQGGMQAGNPGGSGSSVGVGGSNSQGGITLNYTSSNGGGATSLNASAKSVVAQVKENNENTGKIFSFSYTSSQKSNGVGNSNKSNSSLISSDPEDNISTLDENFSFKSNKGYGLGEDDPGKGKSKPKPNSSTKSSNYETDLENWGHRKLYDKAPFFIKKGFDIIEIIIMLPQRIEYPIIIDDIQNFLFPNKGNKEIATK